MAMVTSGSMRASDGERDQVVELLKEHTAQGRLTLEELEERTGAAYAAKTRLQLQQLIEDLPGAAVFGRGERGPIVAGQHAPARTPAWLACCCRLPRRWQP
ncbi:MAG TPA: DUF1707 domain-containing protein [Actinomycetes bacterium]|nr:DUF1707 domain-containing protein [Actinomycetes bacterium]